jgi:hypothetical protein
MQQLFGKRRVRMNPGGGAPSPPGATTAPPASGTDLRWKITPFGYALFYGALAWALYLTVAIIVLR